MKILPALFGLATAGLYHIDTDEWLRSGRFSIGSRNETALLSLDFNHDLTIVPGMGDCHPCKVKTYDSFASSSMDTGTLNVTQLVYRRTMTDPLQVFNGYTVRDKICFNGATNNDSCTDIENPGLEFFVVKDFNGSSKLENSLFKGVIGLSNVPQSKFMSIVEYASLFGLVDNAMVSVDLGK